MTKYLGNEVFDTTYAACDDYKPDMIKEFDEHKELMEFLTVSKSELPTTYSSHSSSVENICNHERTSNILAGYLESCFV